MDNDIALIQKAIQEIISNYGLNPKLAQELLQRILNILQVYGNEEEKDFEKGENE